MKKSLALLGAALAAVCFTAAPSSAAPDKDVIPLDCGSAGTFDVVVNGNGEFTPARDTGSTRVVVPISFHDEHFTATAPDGTVLVDESEDVPFVKGRVVDHSPRHQVTCSYGFSEVLAEEMDGLPAGTTIEFSGEVTGYLTKAK